MSIISICFPCCTKPQAPEQSPSLNRIRAQRGNLKEIPNLETNELELNLPGTVTDNEKTQNVVKRTGAINLSPSKIRPASSSTLFEAIDPIKV